MRLKDHSEYPKRDLTPEHTKRDGNRQDIGAAYAYVDSVLDTSDYVGDLAWHGWALREAFLAGISHAEKSVEVNNA